MWCIYLHYSHLSSEQLGALQTTTAIVIMTQFIITNTKDNPTPKVREMMSPPTKHKLDLIDAMKH